MLTKKASDAIDRHVGGRIRMRRKMLRLSQGAIAKKLGITFQQIQKYEKGINRVSSSRLKQLADLLQVSVSFFFDTPPQIDASFAGGDPFLDPRLTRDLLALARAFNSITDPRVRTAITVLVDATASTAKKESRARRT